MQELAQLQARFEEQVLDSTQAFSYPVEDAARLSGLPEAVVARARMLAEDARTPGWLFKLDQPTYIAIVTHADDADLRRDFYEAWTTRASEHGPDAGRHDNSSVMGRILELRQELAALLGFGSYAQLSLATKMAGSVEEVLRFLEELAARYRPAALLEFEALQAYAGHALQAWDVAYYAERLRLERHAVSEEELRPCRRCWKDSTDWCRGYTA
jgi:oligopeptidase A